MNYHNILHNDMMNGEGLRTVLFVSGCTHGCKGCQNPQTWSKSSGIPFGEEELEEIIDSLEPDEIDGLTLSGGDPLYEGNLTDIGWIISRIRSVYGNKKTIWLYTGYTLEEVAADEERADIVFSCDVVVDGKFELDKFSPEIPWVGSSNQVVHRILDKGDNYYVANE